MHRNETLIKSIDCNGNFLKMKTTCPGSEKDTAAGPYYCNGIDGLQPYVYIWLGGYVNKDAVVTVTLLV